MKQTTQSFYPSDPVEFKLKLLNWALSFSIFSFFDNHQYKFQESAFDYILATGSQMQTKDSPGSSLEEIKKISGLGQWLFGHLSYDLKNEIEGLSSANPDPIGFPDSFFYIPETVVRIIDNQCQISTIHPPATIYQSIGQTEISPKKPGYFKAPMNARFSKSAYLETIKELQKHLQKGDCYEINFCQEFYREHSSIDPLSVYLELMATSPSPFSAFYRLQDKYCISASPERFIQKKGNHIQSQPIKGTSARDHNDPQADQKSRGYLRTSEKEKSENVMIVDLVRNDLSRICLRGTVKVDELFGLYSFPQVHQMISTVSGELKEGMGFDDVIRATFPMGSMTGAPKRKVMELIEKYERTKRGLFSGSVGYIEPGGDYDFNVIIRSIFYNDSNGYISFLAGGGITFYSDAEKEFEECMLKTEALTKALC